MNKKLYTKKIYDLLPNNCYYKQYTLDKLLFIWWATGRNSSNLRLTEEGKNAFDLVDIEYYDYPLITHSDQWDKTKYSLFTVTIGKKINCPWYLKKDSKKLAYIRLYDSKVAIIVSLYGSIFEYLKL